MTATAPQTGAKLTAAQVRTVVAAFLGWTLSPSRCVAMIVIIRFSPEGRGELLHAH